MSFFITSSMDTELLPNSLVSPRMVALPSFSCLAFLTASSLASALTDLLHLGHVWSLPHLKCGPADGPASRTAQEIRDFCQCHVQYRVGETAAEFDDFHHLIR